MSLFAQTVPATCAHQWIRAFAIGACIAIFADGRAFAQTNEKIPTFVSNPSTWGWVRIREDGRNALYGDGWLDPPAGLRGPVRDHPDFPLQGNTDRALGRQVTLAIGDYMDPVLKPWAAEHETVERGGAFRQTWDAVPGHVAMLSGKRSRTIALDH